MATLAFPTASIILVKQMLYRGKLEEWSNRYHFTGQALTTLGDYTNTWEEIATSEKRCYRPDVSIIRVYGYKPGVAHATYVTDLSLSGSTPIPGTLTQDSDASAYTAGDQSLWIRAHVGQAVNGRSVYVRKYFHGGFLTTTDKDQPDPAWSTACTGHANTMVAGVASGAVWSSPGVLAGNPGGPKDPIQAVTPIVSQWVGIRQLRRRGPRP